DRDAVGRVGEVAGRKRESLPERKITGDGAREHDRLELPGLRVPLPVLEETGDRAGERPVAALRPEVGVDLPACVPDVAHDRFCGVDRLLLLVRTLALVDEDDVEIAGEAGFPRAELAHSDHGK